MPLVYSPPSPPGAAATFLFPGNNIDAQDDAGDNAQAPGKPRGPGRPTKEQVEELNRLIYRAEALEVVARAVLRHSPFTTTSTKEKGKRWAAALAEVLRVDKASVETLQTLIKRVSELIQWHKVCAPLFY